MSVCKIKLKRTDYKETYTVGRLYINNNYFCDTLEDRCRDLSKEKKIYSQTAIPKGVYKLVISYSPRFKRLLPLLLDVPFFEGIRIHAGNSSKDTSGCILVGTVNEVPEEQRDSVKDVEKDWISNSKSTEKLFIQTISQYNEFEIEIE